MNVNASNTGVGDINNGALIPPLIGWPSSINNLFPSMSMAMASSGSIDNTNTAASGNGNGNGVRSQLKQISANLYTLIDYMMHVYQLNHFRMPSLSPIKNVIPSLI
jgi:hypothetical protein